MREVEAADRRRREHRQALGELDRELLLAAQQVEEQPLLGVVGAGRVARRGPDAAVLLADQVAHLERLVLAVAPLAARALVQPLGERLGQAVGERLHHDRGVGVVLALVARDQLVDAEPRGHGEGPDPVGEPRLARRHEVGERLRRQAVALLGLLPQRVQRAEQPRARLVRVELDVVADGGRREEAVGRARLEIAVGHELLQRRLRVVEDLLRLRPPVGVLEDARVGAAQLPDGEERRPVDVRHDLRQLDVADLARAAELRLRRRVARPLDRRAARSRRLQRQQRLLLLAREVLAAQPLLLAAVRRRRGRSASRRP